MTKKCVIWAFFCFFYNVTFSFAFMLTEKLFLLHRLLFIPYSNNPSGGGGGGGLGGGQKNAKKLFYGAVKKSKKFTCFVVYLWGKWAPGKVHLQQFKEGTAKFQTRYVKRVPFVNERYTKGVPFLLKMIYRRVRGWTSKRRGGEGASRKKALLSIYLPRFPMRAEVSFRYCQSRSWFVYAPEQTTCLTGKEYDFV